MKIGSARSRHCFVSKRFQRCTYSLLGYVITSLACLESAAEGSAKPLKLLQKIEEFQTYISNNRPFIVNYGERYRNGERISTGFVESTVNQVISKRMVKKQQMRWSKKGAHLLLQVRTKVLDGDWRETFERWYPELATQAA